MNRRYRLDELLGGGGMGVVYRTYDRLTGQMVALKQVTVAPQELQFASRPMTNDHYQLLLSLAQEFKFLASLRHPNIISVFDYGFDAERRPYYTMELLEEAQTLRAAGQNQPLAVQIDLIVQVLQALTYLHRRGILHHDLKPENVLVREGRVQLLDFGLSMMHDQPRLMDTLGTLLYLAPEIFAGIPYSPSADLYAVGVMAYELLAGRHPFYTGDLDQFFAQLISASPDLNPLPVPLRPVIGALLAKEPSQRYPNAEQAILALCAAAGQPLPPEGGAIRESFLQAATFVGREDELVALTAALGAAQRGQGSTWLVGGESGVGKSRLLDELRIQALVAGALVVYGQGVEGGGAPYQLWREPIRRLVLTTELSDLEAGVLKPLVPDIATLLQRPIPDAPTIGSTESSQRLVWGITRLLGRQQDPLVLLLEDLQWAAESLSLLSDVVRLTADRPVLIVGSYRDDERPHLADEVPGARALPLGRLTPNSIAQLSEAMLGEQGRQPQIVTLLERETEGNAFFMVEVVRALAEGSGGLAGIDEATLPGQVFASGVQRLIARRLQRVLPTDFPLMQLAAVMGRRIDLPALSLAGNADLKNWLLRCADVAVLEVQPEEWRFAHDKLREGVLQQLSVEQWRDLHRQAAACIEQAYAANLAPQASRLADHYRQAGDRDHERSYVRQAGDYATATFAHAEALRHYNRALELADDARERFKLLLAREDIFDWRGEREAQSADLQTLAQIADHLADEHLRVEVALRQVRHAESLGDLPATIQQAQQALALAQAIGNVTAEITARLRWGNALFRQTEYPAARTQLTLALELARTAQLAGLTVDCLLALGYVVESEGDYGAGRDLFEQSLQISREIGDRQRQALALNDLSINLYFFGDLVTSDRYLEASLQLSRSLGRLYDEGVALLNLAVNARLQGSYDLNDNYNTQALSVARTMNNRLLEAYVLGNWGEDLAEIGDFPRAHHLLEQALQLTHSLGARRAEILNLARLSYLALALAQVDRAEEYARTATQLAQGTALKIEPCLAWTGLGLVQLQTRELAAAVQAFQTALDLVKGQRNQPEAINALVGLAQATLAQNQLAQAQIYVDEILAWQATYPLLNLYDMSFAHLTCYQVLAQQQDPRADTILATGYQALQRRAATISDPGRRQNYLSNVRSNRELTAAWQARQRSSSTL